jgi:RNA polymerase sigma factor (sigma-70 family)
MSEKIVELIKIYHKGVDWEKEAARMRGDIVNARAEKKEDDMFYTVGEWLEKVRDAAAEDLIGAIKTWYDNHFEDELELEQQAKMFEIQYNHTGDIAATVRVFESAFVKEDDVLLSSYVADIIAAWAKSVPYNSVLEKTFRHKPPTVDEQIASANALMELVESNKALVQRFLMQKYPTYHKSAEHEDITSEGTLGMMQSLIYYSPEISKFSTFVAPYIKGAISDYLSKKNFGTMHYQVQNKKYVAAMERLQLQGVQSPSITQIAKEMGKGIDAVHRLLSVIQAANAVDLDREEVMEIEDNMTLPPDELVIMKERADLLEEAMRELPEDQRIVIEMKFFTATGKPASDIAIGKKLAEYYAKMSAEGLPVPEVKKDRVKQLRNKAMKRMRERAEKILSDTEMSLASKALKISEFPIADVDEEMSFLEQFGDEDEIEFGNYAL